MFSFLSRYAKTQNTYRRGNSVCGIIALLAVCAALLFSGCPTEPAAGDLNGRWNDGYATITVNVSAKTISYSDNYEGTIVNSPDFTAANGVIIIRFTKYWDQDWSNYPDVTYTENTANVGKYGALYWKDLSDNTVYMADAYTQSLPYTHVMFGTLGEAQNNFTIARAGEYVNWGSGISPYTKQ
jgi:hypothetical protein